jgi:hypothetical protein
MADTERHRRNGEIDSDSPQNMRRIRPEDPEKAVAASMIGSRCSSRSRAPRMPLLCHSKLHFVQSL